MKLFSLCLIATCLSAVDIHQHYTVQPYDVVPDDDATIISFSNGIVFDTRQGEPPLPSYLTIQGYEGTGYYLIQCKGPIYNTWINELRKSGIELLGYVPKYTLVVHASHEALESARTLPYISWIGVFQPAYKVQEELLDAKGRARVTIQIFPNENALDISRQLKQHGAEIIEIIDHKLCKTIDVMTNLETIHTIAHIPGVMWIQRWTEAHFSNNNCQWVTQTGWRSSIPANPGARRIWFQGITGNGIVLSTTDSGITTAHRQYYDAAYPITVPGVYPNHRKIVAYKLYVGATFGDHPGHVYHGTHVNCTAAGNDTMLGSSIYDGMAKDARIYFVDIANATNLVGSTNLTAMYDSIYLGRGLGYHILQHSGSWGWQSTNGSYKIQEASTDAYVWANRDFLNLYAAGNQGSAMKIDDPALAKNVLAVGATLNSTHSNQIASFSSRGSTMDHRIKPNIMAPGDGTTLWSGLISADGSGTTGYTGLQGTSQATPAANGSIGLIRQYLLAGFYPSGAENSVDSIRYQSAALLRAMAMVACDPNVGAWSVPDSNIGWGRIDVDSVLYFSGDTRKLILLDDTIGLNTGEFTEQAFLVNSAIPLRVCVAWSDTAAASYANPTLINDLNMQLTAPSGTYYRGNKYSTGQSVANPAVWDNINVEECCRVNNPELGFWKIKIIGQNIPYAPQPFAYAITGDIIDSTPGITEQMKEIQNTHIDLLSSIVRDKLSLMIAVDAKTRVRVKLYDVVGRTLSTIVDEDMDKGTYRIDRRINLSTGIYFIAVDARDAKRVEKLLVMR